LGILLQVVIIEWVLVLCPWAVIFFHRSSGSWAVGDDTLRLFLKNFLYLIFFDLQTKFSGFIHLPPCDKAARARLHAT
jgi:hypothetical protein